MNNLTITRTNGNIPAQTEGEDRISGLLFYVPAAADIPTGFSTEAVQEVRTINQAEDLGIVDTSTDWFIKVMHYQLSEIFRVNNKITLYVGIYAQKQTPDFAEIKAMQNYADGRIRQIGVWDGTTAPTAANIALIEAQADALELENAPLSVGYAPKVASVAALQALTLTAGNSERVSVIVAQEGSGTGAALYTATANNTDHNSVSCIGVWLAHVAQAKVNESISWVKAFPSGISLPALGDGTLIRSIDKAVIEQLDQKRFLFLTPIVGVSGSYWNDSHNCDVATSDYAFIERVRTMDKAVRGIRANLTPELGGNIYIDAATGKMQPYTVSHLKTTANAALEQMEKDGELSGYVVEIDEDQDVLTTSTVEVVIKNVPVGVMRTMNVKIGFAKTV
jgi:ABC-type amino acid transport substrate-binding protein